MSYGGNPNARVSYNTTWYDGIDRPIASAAYGAIASFSRPTTPPARSDTELVSTTDYDDAGRAWQTTDPKGIVAQATFDAMDRTTQTVEDAGGLARTTQMTYTLDGQTATLTAINGIRSTNHTLPPVG